MSMTDKELFDAVSHSFELLFGDRATYSSNDIIEFQLLLTELANRSEEFKLVPGSYVEARINGREYHYERP